MFKLQVNVELADKEESIKLEGPRDDVGKVKERLEKMIEDMLSRLKHETIVVDPKYHKHIIGKNGANINRIRNETNVTINIEPNGNLVKMDGTNEAVLQVKQVMDYILYNDTVYFVSGVGICAYSRALSRRWSFYLLYVF